MTEWRAKGKNMSFKEQRESTRRIQKSCREEWRVFVNQIAE